VVDATKQERKINKDFPRNCFVVENQGIDGLIIAADENGNIYSVNYDKKELIYNSLVDYLHSCVERAK
jgi:hypothetical protein